MNTPAPHLKVTAMAKRTKLGLKYRASIERDGWWHCLEEFIYHSRHFNREVLIRKGQERDGATMAVDINTTAWWVHDQLCDDTVWLDGTPTTAWQAAIVLSEILRMEGFWARAIYWRWATLLLGCTETRKNGFFWHRKRK